MMDADFCAGHRKQFWFPIQWSVNYFVLLHQLQAHASSAQFKLGLLFSIVFRHICEPVSRLPAPLLAAWITSPKVLQELPAKLRFGLNTMIKPITRVLIQEFSLLPWVSVFLSSTWTGSYVCLLGLFVSLSETPRANKSVNSSRHFALGEDLMYASTTHSSWKCCVQLDLFLYQVTPGEISKSNRELRNYKITKRKSSPESPVIA